MTWATFTRDGSKHPIIIAKICPLVLIKLKEDNDYELWVRKAQKRANRGGQEIDFKIRLIAFVIIWYKLV